MHKVFYVCYYDDNVSHTKRKVVPSATTKINYICSVLNRCALEVQIVSASETTTDGCACGERKQILPSLSLVLFSSIGAGSSIRRVLSRWWTKTMLFTYILRKLKKEDNVIVYHSLGYMGMIRFLKRLIGFRLILEVEEIYGDVMNSAKVVAKERKFFECADAYIFPTQLLDESINTDKKPRVIVHGSYQVEPEVAAPANDGKIHVVYGGTLDPRKGGAAAAAAAAAYLPDNYHIHILGFGQQHEIEHMKQHVLQCSLPGHAQVTYDGCVLGDDYTRFIQQCHIGMSTQNPDAAFNATSFPSKVLIYLGNGLQVVSIRIPAIEKSAVSHVLHYYDEQTPEEIAKAIMSVNLTEAASGRPLLKQLNTEFQKQISTLLQ